jgi:hypothetical protein
MEDPHTNKKKQIEKYYEEGTKAFVIIKALFNPCIVSDFGERQKFVHVSECSVLMNELFGTANDLLNGPSMLSSLEIKDITNFVTGTEDEIDIVLGMSCGKAETDSGRDQWGSAVSKEA